MTHLLRKLKMSNLYEQTGSPLPDNFYTLEEQEILDFLYKKLNYLTPYTYDRYQQITYYMIDETAGYLVEYDSSNKRIYLSHDKFYTPFYLLLNRYGKVYYHDYDDILIYYIRKILKISATSLIAYTKYSDNDVIMNFREMISKKYQEYWKTVDGL
jgi:hypothetical protein